jgi:GT2 family glycosyltransferase
VPLPTAVVVTWQAADRTAVCLDRLAEVAPAAPVVVVDNQSDPARLARVLGERPVTALPLPDNRGLAGGANAGLDRAFADGASHAVLLNDDVLVAVGCLEALVETAGSDSAASPRIHADGPDAFAGGLLDARGFGRHTDGAVEYLTGAALCIPAGVWARVGTMDERLFLYYEDVDWCLRARALGVSLRVADRAEADHAAGSSTGGGGGPTWAYYSTRNRLWVLARRRGARVARREATGTALRALARLAQPGRRAVARAKLDGVRDFRRGRMGRGPYPR